ncbi:uncharacterized protein LOC128674277 isoform X2 [Plodia interpunctella]|uniref:uncharacterized protein LOC128674277 isoform X2 n=1 Tax=Plodia interpunctella TaxID=58824 RepID=UPI002368A1A3|nr:uncharacterized protein LOC128674277 isoform X2 [Plodia interpunctella]
MFKLFVICAMASVAFGATAISRLPPKPAHLAHKEGCYIQEIGDVVPFGTVLTGPQCVRITCGRMIDYASCGLIMTDDPKCYVTKGDYSKQYPDCCPEIECENDNYV